MRLGLGLGLQYKNKTTGGGTPAPTGILDSYTGAAFAFAPDVLIYSAHSVTDSAVGSVTNGQTDAFTVRVRRSSDNAVISFTYTEVSDGTLATWVGAGNDGFVEAAYDQSGNGNHATQSTAANQPKIVNAGSLVVENGKAALDFDGVDYIDCPLGVLATPNHVFCIYKQDRIYTLGGRTLFCSVNQLSSLFFVFGTDSYAYNDGGSSVVSALAQNVNQNLSNTLFNGASSKMRINAQQVAAGDAGSTGINDLRLGSRNTSSNHWVGLVQTLIVYSSDETTNELAIETAINNEYTIY